MKLCVCLWSWFFRFSLSRDACGRLLFGGRWKWIRLYNFVVKKYRLFFREEVWFLCITKGAFWFVSNEKKMSIAMRLFYVRAGLNVCSLFLILITQRQSCAVRILLSKAKILGFFLLLLGDQLKKYVSVFRNGNY